MRAADNTPGSQRARTAALTAVLLLTGARLTEVTSADITDLGTSGGRRVLWVTRANGRRQALPLPGPAASRIDTYLAGRAGQAGTPVLFATRTGRRLFPADVQHTLHRLAIQAGLPAGQARHLGPRMIRLSFAALYPQAGELPRTLRSSPSRPPAFHGHPAPSPLCPAPAPDPRPWLQSRPHCRGRQPRHAHHRR